MSDPIFDSALLSMCMTWRHNFGLLDRKERMEVRRELLGLYEHHVKPAIIRAKAAEFTAHTFSIACDAHKRRAERAESIILDESMDHKAHGFCDCPLCKFAESIAPPADASTMGGEREQWLVDALNSLSIKLNNLTAKFELQRNVNFTGGAVASSLRDLCEEIKDL